MLGRVGMEFQGKLNSLVRIKAELLKRLQSVWSIDNTTHPQQNDVEGDLGCCCVAVE